MRTVEGEVPFAVGEKHSRRNKKTNTDPALARDRVSPEGLNDETPEISASNNRARVQ